MQTADCQKYDIEGKTLGLHSTVSSEINDENARLNDKSHSKKAEKCVRNCESRAKTGGQTVQLLAGKGSRSQ
jgi:hypothetical protein